MNIKRITIILFMVCFLVFSSSCSNENSNANITNTGKQSSSSVASDNLKGDIEIYLLRKGIEERVAETLNLANPQVNVKLTYITDLEQYIKRLSTQTMAGEGPDVILFKPYTINSLYKMIQNQLFLDMEPLIKQDNSFNPAGYNEEVMKSGIFDGKRYVVPLEFIVHSFVTTDEILIKNGIKTNMQNWSRGEFNELIKEYGDGNYFFDSAKPFSDYLVSSGLKFIDYNKNKTYFHTPDFLELLNNYKVYYEACANDEAYNNPGEMMKKGTVIGSGNNKIINPFVLWKTQSGIHSTTNGRVRLFPYPSIEGNARFIASPYSMAAINSNSKNQKLAFEFIKTLLSKDIQKEEIASYAAPVNKQAFDEIIQYLSSDQGFHKELGFIPIPRDLVSDLQFIVSNIARCEIQDSTVLEFINSAAEEYIQGKCTEEQAVNSMEQKIILYLNE
jgi:multiple sugar transport system substrate-binding protein